MTAAVESRKPGVRSRKAEEILEFPQVIGILRRYVASPLGTAEIERLRPLEDRAQAEESLAETGEAMEYLRPTEQRDRKSTRLNSSHIQKSRMPSSA